MISVHRVYELKDISHNHAHIEINPVGVIDIEIVEKKEHHWAEFKDLSFKSVDDHTRLCGTQDRVAWTLDLDSKDAEEVTRLIEEARDEYEILMRDL